MEETIRGSENQLYKYQYDGKDREAKYTESKVHSTAADALGAYYNAQEGTAPDSGGASVYPKDLLDTTWTGPNWAAARWDAAEEVNKLIVEDAGNPAAKTQMIDKGELKERGPKPQPVDGSEASSSQQAIPEDVQTVMNFTGATQIQATKALALAHGNVQDAVNSFF